MKRINEKEILQLVGLGVISGMRATFASAITAHFLSKRFNTALSKTKLRFIQSPVTAVVTKLVSAAEIIGDKLPNTPNRIIAPQLIARVASGSLAGGVISAANKDSIAKGALIGSLTAFAATFLTFYLRKYISTSTFIKEPLTGVVEEGVAIGAGILLLR